MRIKSGAELLISLCNHHWVSHLVLVVKNPPANAGDSREAGLITGWGRSPGVGRATHSSPLAWEIPWTEESGGLQSMGCKESDRTERTRTPSLAHRRPQIAKWAVGTHLLSVKRVNEPRRQGGTPVPHVMPDLALPRAAWGQSGVLDLPSVPDDHQGAQISGL